MRIKSITPNNFNREFAISLFKEYVLKINHTPWHTLGSYELWDRLNEWNALPENRKLQLDKWWD